MESYIHTTDRLGLRRWQSADRVSFANLNADSDVMHYFERTRTREESDASIERFETHFDKHGFGFYATDILETGEFIGMIGMQHVAFEAPFTPAIEIGWRLAKSFWGKGYAPEGAMACLQWAIESLKLDKVVSFTPVINYPSRRVMEKIGMHEIDVFQHPRLPDQSRIGKHALYVIDNITFTGK